MIRASNFRSASRANVRGFTLVELLVVIGIIALLISMLLPALNSARRQASATACLANIRQMGQSMQMYTNEWKVYPGCWGQATSGAVVATWPTRLRSYMKGSQGVFLCPTRDAEVFGWKLTDANSPMPSPVPQPLPQRAVDRDTGWGYRTGEFMILRDGGSFSYGYNDWGAGQGGGGQGGNFGGGRFITDRNEQLGLGGDVYGASGYVKPARVRRPHEMIVITDRGNDLVTSDVGYRHNIDPRNPNEGPRGVHKGAANVLWADGHATPMPLKDIVLYDPKTNVSVPIQFWTAKNVDRVAAMWNNTGVTTPRN